MQCMQDGVVRDACSTLRLVSVTWCCSQRKHLRVSATESPVVVHPPCRQAAHRQHTRMQAFTQPTASEGRSAAC
jgi:hypothetical protein